MTTTNPATTTALNACRRALVENVTWMAETGETMPGAAARLGITPGSLRVALGRVGREDLAARLLANADPAYPVRGTIRQDRRAA